MNILNKIRSLPEKNKKIIFWLIMFVVVVFLFSFYVQDMQQILKESEGKDLLDQSYFQKAQEQVNEVKERIFNNKE